MAFIDNFNKAVTGSPWLGAINLAGEAVGLIPSSIAPPIGLALQATAGIYQEIQTRKE